MDDTQITHTIGELVAEEHQLRSKSVGSGGDEQTRARLSQVEAQLDQCWDLLRQRRAREEYHENPDDAKARPIDEVESYQQ